MLLSLTWRNLLRNRRRSAITVSSIAIGLAAMTFLWGFIDGMNRQMVQNTTRYFAGDVQIHLEGYHDDPTLDRTMDDVAQVLRVVRSHPEVAAASQRMAGKALASHRDKSRGVTVTGVEPGDEVRVSVLFDAIVDGGPLVDGEAGVLIGERLAEALRVRPGDELVFVGQAYDGSLASARFPVCGVFRSKIDDLDGLIAVTTLAAASELYAAPEAASAVALRLRDPERMTAVRADLARRLGDRYEVLDWPRLLPMVAVSVRFHEVVSAVVHLVFFVVAAAAVANPVLMALLERTRPAAARCAVRRAGSWRWRGCPRPRPARSRTTKRCCPGICIPTDYRSPSTADSLGLLDRIRISVDPDSSTTRASRHRPLRRPCSIRPLRD